MAETTTTKVAHTPGHIHDYATCRFCGESSLHASDDMVKYGVRHYAHFKCYLDAGKTLDSLFPWQLGKFPFRLLKDRGLLAIVEKRIAEDRGRA